MTIFMVSGLVTNDWRSVLKLFSKVKVARLGSREQKISPNGHGVVGEGTFEKKYQSAILESAPHFYLFSCHFAVNILKNKNLLRRIERPFLILPANFLPSHYRKRND